MRRVRNTAPVLALLLSGCALNGAPISPHGRPATIDAAGARTSGELIAVSPDTIWLLSDTTLVRFASAGVRRVEVQRHTFGMRRTLRWTSLAGLSTGIALAIACQSYENSDEGGGDAGYCFAAVPVTALAFAAAGLLFGSLNEDASKHRLAPGDGERLRPFTRYPQGLPDSLRHARTIPPPQGEPRRR